MALRRNPARWLMDGVIRYTLQFADQRLDEDSGMAGYRVYRSEIHEEAETARLKVRRKSGERRLVCSGCGRSVREIAEVGEREIRDLPCFEYRTTVVIELYRVRCPDCGVKTEKVGPTAESSSIQQTVRGRGGGSLRERGGRVAKWAWMKSTRARNRNF